MMVIFDPKTVIFEPKTVIFDSKTLTNILNLAFSERHRKVELIEPVSSALKPIFYIVF